MKKVMIIAYNYPPKMGVGILRTVEFEKYLPCFGWAPFIHTVRLKDNVKKLNCYRSFYINLKYFLNFLDSIVRIPAHQRHLHRQNRKTFGQQMIGRFSHPVPKAALVALVQDD